MKTISFFLSAFLLAGILSPVLPASPEVFNLTLHEAEKQAVVTSNRLKSAIANEAAAHEQAGAQFTGLLPKLSFQASYQYNFNLPQISLGPNFPAIPFGNPSNYQIGPTLSYTLWDSFSSRKTYESASLLASARAEDRKSTQLQLVYALQSAYIQTQVALEELRLINDSLDLAKAQDKDVVTRFRAGAAAQLDLVTSERSVLSYEIQLRQRQADLSSTLKDLLALLTNDNLRDLSHPGPPGLKNVSLVLQLDSLEQSLKELDGQSLPELTDDQPQLKSLELQAHASDLSASSFSAKLFPTVQVSGGLAYTLPNIPEASPYWAEAVGVSLSIPLYFGDPSPHLAAQQRSESQALEFQRGQAKEDLARDFTKARVLLGSLHEQKELAADDVVKSAKAARLYYMAYRAGKVNLIDVQNANLQALQSKVNAARIDAQILNQLSLLKSLAGKESLHD